MQRRELEGEEGAVAAQRRAKVKYTRIYCTACCVWHLFLYEHCLCLSLPSSYLSLFLCYVLSAIAASCTHTHRRARIVDSALLISFDAKLTANCAALMLKRNCLSAAQLCSQLLECFVKPNEANEEASASHKRGRVATRERASGRVS